MNHSGLEAGFSYTNVTMYHLYFRFRSHSDLAVWCMSCIMGHVLYKCITISHSERLVHRDYYDLLRAAAMSIDKMLKKKLAKRKRTKNGELELLRLKLHWWISWSQGLAESVITASISRLRSK